MRFMRALHRPPVGRPHPRQRAALGRSGEGPVAVMSAFVTADGLGHREDRRRDGRPGVSCNATFVERAGGKPRSSPTSCCPCIDRGIPDRHLMALVDTDADRPHATRAWPAHDSRPSQGACETRILWAQVTSVMRLRTDTPQTHGRQHDQHARQDRGRLSEHRHEFRTRHRPRPPADPMPGSAGNRVGNQHIPDEGGGEHPHAGSVLHRRGGGAFFQRTEFRLPGLTAARDELERAFAIEVAGPFG